MANSSPSVCVQCGRSLEAGAGVCPACGEEQPVRWMVLLTYGLLALFFLGLIYRLLRP